MIKISVEDMTLASWVTPPTDSWMRLLDKDAATGPHWKKEPTVVERPCESCVTMTWLKQHHKQQTKQ
jgi:hypothetical protein